MRPPAATSGGTTLHLPGPIGRAERVDDPAGRDLARPGRALTRPQPPIAIRPVLEQPCQEMRLKSVPPPDRHERPPAVRAPLPGSRSRARTGPAARRRPRQARARKAPRRPPAARPATRPGRAPPPARAAGPAPASRRRSRSSPPAPTVTRAAWARSSPGVAPRLLPAVPRPSASGAPVAGKTRMDGRHLRLAVPVASPPRRSHPAGKEAGRRWRTTARRALWRYRVNMARTPPSSVRFRGPVPGPPGTAEPSGRDPGATVPAHPVPGPRADGTNRAETCRMPWTAEGPGREAGPRRREARHARHPAHRRGAAGPGGGGPGHRPRATGRRPGGRRGLRPDRARALPGVLRPRPGDAAARRARRGRRGRAGVPAGGRRGPALARRPRRPLRLRRLQPAPLRAPRRGGPGRAGPAGRAGGRDPRGPP